jgi:hypothetical protein
VRRAVGGWNAFWFAPTETSTLAVVRILYGLVVIGWSLSMLPDLGAFYSSHGVLPTQPAPAALGLGTSAWGVLSGFNSQAALTTLYVATVAGAICLTVGLATRLASIVVFIGTLSLTRRNPFIDNSGDVLIRIIAFYLMLAPAGAALSMDRWLRARDRFWEFQPRAPWALRLLQIQMSILYLSAVWDKVRSGSSWNDGTALSYVLRIKDVQRFSLPTFTTDSPVINLMTYGTLAIELGLGVLVWNRKLRPWVLVAGIALHLGIDYTIRVGWFSYAVIAALISFVPAASMSRALLGARERVTGRGGLVAAAEQ